MKGKDLQIKIPPDSEVINTVGIQERINIKHGVLFMPFFKCCCICQAGYLKTWLETKLEGFVCK